MSKSNPNTVNIPKEESEKNDSDSENNSEDDSEKESNKEDDECEECECSEESDDEDEEEFDDTINIKMSCGGRTISYNIELSDTFFDMFADSDEFFQTFTDRFETFLNEIGGISWNIGYEESSFSGGSVVSFSSSNTNSILGFGRMGKYY